MRMIYLVKRYFLYVTLFLAACGISCVFSGCAGAGSTGSGGTSADEAGSAADADAAGIKASITFASWNAQTFFDARTEGTEYDDFKKSGNWSKDKYQVRLGRLCEVMTTLNPDVIVLEEIENEAVVQDIANQLAGKSWSRSKRWDYAFFAKESGAAIGCAVFSRYRLSDVSTHSMDIRCQKDAQPQSRPVVQFSVEAGGRQLWVLANHWKSKLGADESRIWRQWQEALACGRLAALEGDVGGGGAESTNREAVILCGDFNQDAQEFCCDFKSAGRENVIFRGIGAGGGLHKKVYSPWFTQGGALSTKIGSYFYQGQWERIDHIFSAGRARIAVFAPRAEEPWADSEQKPVAYRLYNGEGYSDHLPVLCTVSF